MHPNDVICGALDPVLVPAGFAAGQGGRHDSAGQVIYCAGHDDFSERHPALPQAGDQQYNDSPCTDLVVEYDGDHIMKLDLEGIAVRDTLRAIGRQADADAVERALKQPVEPALSVLGPVLRRLFA